MSKRHISPAPGPPPKRPHTTRGRLPTTSSQPSFDALLYDEIVLVIFSYLSWSDLCTIQPINRNWSRLSLDNQLWKGLYLKEYGRSRLRGARGFVGRADGREIRPLPGWAKTDDPDIRDWKWMFRISSNWRTGRCSVEHVSSTVHDPTHESKALTHGEGYTPEKHLSVLLAGDVTITALSAPSHPPSLLLISPHHSPHILPCPSLQSSGSAVEVTCLAIDQSQPSGHDKHHVRLVCFLSTGEYSVFSIDHHTPSSSRHLGSYTPSSAVPSARVKPIIQSAYHHPLLVALSQNFHLSLYDLNDHNHILHAQTLTSYTSYPPTSLVLSSPSPTTYKLVLAYAVPVYPAHWSVGATELLIHNDRREASAVRNAGIPMVSVTNTRSTKAFDIPPGWVDEQKLLAVKEQWSRKVARVADTQTDGKWVILAPGDPSIPALSPSQQTPTSLQLYRLHLPASRSSSATPKMTFVRTLHGHMSPVSALAVADGRCVSLGADGSIWVWDLESGTAAEVSVRRDDQRYTRHLEGSYSEDSAVLHRKKSTIVFDERRIVSANARGLEIRRFDI